MIVIDDFLLLKVLRKCRFGEIYLSRKKNSDEYFMTKSIKTEISKEEKRFISNEISFLQSVNHPNIIKIKGIKKSKTNLYILYEYINKNGYYLSQCLQEYKKKFNKAFPELFIQHLMRQILEALVLIHEKQKILTNLNINNIIVNFNSKNDKENLNMKNTKIKLIDFEELFSLGFEFKRNRFETRICSFFDLNVGFNYYIDILCLGNICYELLMGKPVFDAKSLFEFRYIKGLYNPLDPNNPYNQYNPYDLYEKIKEGIGEIFSSISSEFASFLKDILLYSRPSYCNYDSCSKYSKKLLNHPFLSKYIYLESSTEKKYEECSKSLKELNIDRNNEDEFSITSLKPGEKIIAINFMTLGNQDIVHYSIAGKNTNSFSLLLKKFYKLYPLYKNKKLRFMLNTKFIENIDQTLEEIGIKYNSIISIIEI